MTRRVHGLTPEQLARLFSVALRALPEQDALSLLTTVLAGVPEKWLVGAVTNLLAGVPEEWLVGVEASDIEPHGAPDFSDRELSAWAVLLPALRGAASATREVYAASDAAMGDKLAADAAAFLERSGS